MEQDLAQFRAAVDVVGDMVAAEEGRIRRAGREREMMVQRTSATPSPFVFMPIHALPPRPTPPAAPSARDAEVEFPDYISIDESLPAYDDDRDDSSDSVDSSVVADGFRPGAATYTPSSGSEAGTGVNDVLGAPKN